MSWLALLLIGVGVTDLVFSIRPMRYVPEGVGAGAVVLFALLSGLTDSLDLAAVLLLVLTVLAWGITVTWGFSDRGRPWVPLAVLGTALLVALLAAPAAGEVDGLVGDWLAEDPVPGLGAIPPDIALLVLGAFLVQLSTGNVLVRLVLAATGTINPLRHGGAAEGVELQLKGGRLLGPMERVFLLGLGLAGQLTAASIVIAAKGLLRWPELQSKQEQHRIHQLTEYFLVGSFVSWLVALTSLLLVRV